MRRVTSIVAAMAAGSMVLAGCGGSSSEGGASSTASGASPAAAALKVGLAYDIGGRGDGSFNDSAAAGLDKAKTDLGIEFKELSASPNETESDRESRLTLLAEGGYDPVIAVGFSYAKSLGTVAAKFPKTHFAIVDDNTIKAANVADLVFAENEGSYLVGYAAGLKTKSGTVGFIGGCDIPLIHKFEAGFNAGAKAAKPDIKLAKANYLSTGAQGCSGFAAPDKGKVAADGMYGAGADIIFAAAGASGTGVFQSALAKKTLAIGVDSDQYESAAPELKPVIMTSMLKRVDVAVYETIKSAQSGSPLTGEQLFDLKKDGVGYSTSGGQVDDIKDKLDKVKASIVDGSVTVPTQ